jgi:hypothetical protein
VPLAFVARLGRSMEQIGHPHKGFLGVRQR